MSERHPYATHAYARGLAARDGSRAIDVPGWSTCVLGRPIAAGGEDAAGPYPRTPLRLDADLAGGLAELQAQGLVSAVLVADPMASPPPETLARAFFLCRPFKTHLVVDRAAGPFEPTKHHRDRIRRAGRRCAVQVLSLAERLDDWQRLYDTLIARHAIEGVATFSPAYFEALAADTRFVAFVAEANDDAVGMAIWFQHEGIAYSHLTASDAAGFAAGANYALYDAAISHFVDAHAIDLGAGAGLDDDPDDGLAQFKAGFANSRATAWLCGAVLDAARYAALSEGRTGGFFPAYRG